MVTDVKTKISDGISQTVFGTFPVQKTVDGVKYYERFKTLAEAKAFRKAIDEGTAIPRVPNRKSPRKSKKVTKRTVRKVIKSTSKPTIKKVIIQEPTDRDRVLTLIEKLVTLL